ncbi:metallophosphoesterase [Janthinobacterium sp. UMAB-56]|uniref:metallophosphoesterase family protein n=1 Tax=Janthinobacterium sp. UMAB-56 TaxID=1365361 RepID=UPI001C57F96D|nr:metallophosphoesterase [Janthinobacterium sp. UMAB-56]
MKILHASDLHYSPGNLDEADRCFGHAVEQAIVNDVAVAMLTGDLTDHALDGHSPALLALAKRIKQLADHCPVFLLQGTFSHEPVGLLKMLEMIGANHPIVVSDKIGMIGLADGKWLDYDPTYADVQYDLVITSVPTVNKAELALVVGADNASVEMGNHLAALLGLFGPANAALRRRGVPTVLASHGTVDGSLNESGVPMAGMDHEFSLGALFSANTSATMLGHIHMHQQWTREHDGRMQRIAYPGSIGRYHYGELGEKYCLIWEVSADTADFTLVQTPSKRMIEIAFEGIPNLDELATVAEQCRGAFVRVRYSVDEEFARTIDRQAIKQILGASAEVKIEGEVLTIQRQRCAGISSLSSVEERFIKWCEFTQTPTSGLAERLSQLQTMAPEDIASAFNSTNKRPGQSAPDPSGPPANTRHSETEFEDQIV